MMGLIALSKTPKGRGERLRRAQAPFFCFESPHCPEFVDVLPQLK
jgi:hypothetical protein